MVSFKIYFKFPYNFLLKICSYLKFNNGLQFFFFQVSAEQH